MKEVSITKVSTDYLPEWVLAEWVKAITSFHKNFCDLLAVLNQPVGKRNSKVVAIAYSGQCPVSQLLALHKLMEDELIRLSQDIHPATERSQEAVRKNYEMLGYHTDVLNQLNQRAQRALYLATQSNS